MSDEYRAGGYVPTDEDRMGTFDRRDDFPIWAWVAFAAVLVALLVL